MKQCIKCKEVKSLESFEKERNACRSCRNSARAARPKKEYAVTLESKCCAKCKETKQASEFNIDTARVGGLHSYCNQCRSSKNKKVYKNNPEQKIKQSSEYYQANKTEVIKKANKRQKVRLKTDPKFLLKRRLRARLYSALKSRQWSKTNSFVEYIGCSQEELKHHIEKQFTFGMSWDNVGEWHIDHIIPLSSAATEEELYKLCHYTNLQPLWALDNIKKGDRVD